MTFTFTPAVRERVSLLISLAGASGSGKTMSALKLAQGISPSGKTFFLDTEARRGLHYSDSFSFMHADMRAPFRPSQFVEAVKAAEDAGAEVVIIDSFSMEYDGVGGIIEWADDLAEKGIKSPGNWKEPKLAHRKMMNELLQCRATLIFCLRADEKIEIIREGGRTQVRPLGWMPICEKRFPYEMTASFVLTPDNPGVPHFDLPHKLQEQHRAFFPEGRKIGEESGKLLAEWARGGVLPPAVGARAGSSEMEPPGESATAPERTIDELKDAGWEIAKEGMVPLAQFWGSLSAYQKKAVGGKDTLDRWKAEAERFASEEAAQ